MLKQEEAFTSMSHGLRFSSIITSYPYISKQCLSLMITLVTARQGLTHNACHVMRFLRSQVTRVCSVEDYMAGSFCQALPPVVS